MGGFTSLQLGQSIAVHGTGRLVLYLNRTQIPRAIRELERFCLILTTNMAARVVTLTELLQSSPPVLGRYVITAMCL